MEKACKWCKSEFVIDDQDMVFYKKVGPVFDGVKYEVAPPTLCPDCRQQRRCFTRNERKFYIRKCDLSGRNMVTVYAPEFSGKVYDHDSWHGDEWDPCDYSRDFDFERGFFEQFQELALECPRINLIAMNSENSTYTNHSAYNKNCFMCINTGYSEDLFYCTNYNLKNKDCGDCMEIQECERCYFCTGAQRCHFSTYLFECEGMTDSHFCFDCRNCESCFGCYNLRRKKYCIYNEQYSKEDYLKKMEELMPKTWPETMTLFDELMEMKKEKAINKSLWIEKCQNCSGDQLDNNKNVKDSYYVYGSEDCRYCYDAGDMKDCYDVTEPYNEELFYEVQASFHGYHNIACCKSLESKNSLYCYYCWQCEDCFGCFGMRKKKYCIFNKQYTREEYEKMVPRIIEHMRETAEWGEFFPPEDCAFGYNETIAFEYYPMSREEVLARGWKWRDQQEEVKSEEGDSIVKCEVTNRSFRIIKAEADFYEKMKLPLPGRHPDERHYMRMSLRNPRRVRKSECTKCGIYIETSCPEDVKKVYCEKCYLEEVY